MLRNCMGHHRVPCPVHFLAHLSTARRHIGRGGHDVDLGPVATTFLAHGEGVAPLGTSAWGQLDGAATVLASAQRRILA